MTSIVSLDKDEMFVDAIHTLMYSWGSDSPPEAYWAREAFLSFRASLDGVTVPEIKKYLTDNFKDCEDAINLNEN